jgi:hypothetical protein
MASEEFPLSFDLIGLQAVAEDELTNGLDIPSKAISGK